MTRFETLMRDAALLVDLTPNSEAFWAFATSIVGELVGAGYGPGRAEQLVCQEALRELRRRRTS